ncbi:hypothetical protein M406DRAFT_352117 [Cryphonectria parasitica EP155]|uniref:Glycoside hydrolase subgroup catalytic core n=1 Tax=Cryphonectria parasitica (strain ATCC 38755 / EP155) TaxID=660469 RepID=A0A9P4Y1Z9_CRYP1|nr:uncharacterized protein M406DRAFT_352117 [Cryphonectria parasitica EP155]KAF3765193.1 hypothetical protein M406DRAFT_352117 [Cryphonectria parasitica EP155]
MRSLSTWTALLLELLLLASRADDVTAQFNNPAGVDIWCGKAYRPENASFNPGGWFVDPETNSSSLRLKAKPRMSIYLDTDATAALLVDAETASQYGADGQQLQVTISSDGVSLGSAVLDAGSVDNEVAVDLSLLTPRMDPYSLEIQATTLANSSTTAYQTSTNLSYLPYPDSYGSVARLDNLYGGTQAQRGKNSSWVDIYPYTYYVQWSLYWDANVSTLNDFSSTYNMIHIVPTGTLQDEPFPWDQFQPYLDRAAELGIWLQYDVLWTPDNLTSMIEQVSTLRTHPSILSWYQSDEPDGKGNPLNSTGIAYNVIKSLDPYHPISLALNCYDFYYEDYAAGADIITPDVYPISTNLTYSTVYDTVCNATYGCCGCDDCGTGTTVFSDISHRLDEFRRRDSLIGWAKTQWFAPQAFGNETFWTRYPTAPELEVMTLLAVNHGAKAVVNWDFPTSSELSAITSDLAALFNNTAVTKFLIGTPRTQDLVVVGGANIDAALWVDESGGKALVSVANLNYYAVTGSVTVSLPSGISASGVSGNVWGNSTWQVGNGTVGIAAGLDGLETAIFVISLV